MVKNVKEKYTGPRVKDTETFIQKARWVHGNKYSYEKVRYKNNSTDVVITCEHHGDFKQRSGNHLSGKGCALCGAKKSIDARLRDTDWFIISARETHGDLYNYDQVAYTGIFDKVIIVCPKHGEFKQSAKNHIDGSGCPECSSKRPFRKQASYYISKANQIHKNKYDYSKVLYRGVKTKVEIICPDHGSFWQTFDNHAHGGKMCPDCAKVSQVINSRKDTNYFKEKSKEVFGDLYCYDLVDYVHQYEEVSILCKEHGVFNVPPVRHYQGQGCPKCSKENLGAHNKVPLEDFLLRSTEAHKGFYKYDKVSYSTLRDKVTIICPKHGEYLQRAGEHMRGKGCRECWLESYGYGVNGYYGTDKPSSIYVLKINNEFIKIGLSNNTYRRMLSIAKQSGYSVEKVLQVDGIAYELFDLEQHILRSAGLNQFTPQHKFNGISECLELSELPKVLQIIEDWVDNQSEECHTETSHTKKEI